jgi:hypothetical protein
MTLLVPGENPGLTNIEYHSEKLHLSSSNLKMLLENPAKFYQEKMLGNKPEEAPKPHYILGSFVHTLVLEPELVAKEYAFFEGWRKAGKDYQEFLLANPGKTVISKPQRNVGENLARATQSNKHLPGLLQGGVAELSLASHILDVPVKMRADYINKDRAFILDLKTTAQPTDVDIFRTTVKEFSYDLSAALYCQIAAQVYGKVFDFYWAVISKDDLGCAVYKASSATLSKGAGDVLGAIVKYKKCVKSGIWDLNSKPVNDSVNEDIVEI